MTGAGAGVSGWEPRGASAVSAAGRVIVGDGRGPQGFDRGWGLEAALSGFNFDGITGASDDEDDVSACFGEPG